MMPKAAEQFLVTFSEDSVRLLENVAPNDLFRIATIGYKDGVFIGKLICTTTDKVAHAKARRILKRHSGLVTVMIAHRWSRKWQVVAWYGLRPTSPVTRAAVAKKFTDMMLLVTPDEAFSDGDDPADKMIWPRQKHKPLERYPIPPNPHDPPPRPCPDRPAPGDGNSDCAIPDTFYDYNSSETQ